MKLSASPVFLLAALAGCAAATPPVAHPRVAHPRMAHPPVEQADGLSRARLGQTIAVGGPKVTPLTVIEDSRCPMNARCVWAGRVRLSVRIDLGSGSQTREITQGAPIPVADGTLELVEVQPDKAAGGQHAGLAAHADYEFGFRFMGGL